MFCDVVPIDFDFTRHNYQTTSAYSFHSYNDIPHSFITTSDNVEYVNTIKVCWLHDLKTIIKNLHEKNKCFDIETFDFMETDINNLKDSIEVNITDSIKNVKIMNLRPSQITCKEYDSTSWLHDLTGFETNTHDKYFDFPINHRVQRTIHTMNPIKFIP